MDAFKKFATEKIQEQLSGNHNQQQQHQGSNQNQGYSQNQGGYGGQESSNIPGGYGGQQQQSFQGQGQGQDFGVTGGPQYNAPHGSGGAGSAGGGSIGGLLSMMNLDQGQAINAANAQNGNGNENASMFSSALSMFGQKGQNAQDVGDLDGDGDVDEDDVKIQYQRAYEQKNTQGMSANSMGAAAALAAMKKFTGGQDKPVQQQGGNMQSGLVGMAMSEGAKLFDQNGGAAQGGKQDVINSAAGTIIKLMLKSKMTGMTGGGNSGGLGSLMSMAGKFM